MEHSFHIVFNKVGAALPPGFCPILSQRDRRVGARRRRHFGAGHPRAMLAPDGTSGKRKILANNLKLWYNISDISSHRMSGFSKRFLIKYRQTGGMKNELDNRNAKSNRLY